MHEDMRFLDLALAQPMNEGLSLELVWALSVDHIKFVLIQYFTLQSGIREFSFKALSSLNRSYTRWCTSEDQVSFLDQVSAVRGSGRTISCIVPQRRGGDEEPRRTHL
jgi:hypothetical protein